VEPIGIEEEFGLTTTKEEIDMQKTAALIGVGILLLATGHAVAQLSPADRTFATKAAAGGQAEVTLGRLATEKGGSQQVRQFGQQMVTDHSQANQELQAIAKQQNLTLPSKPDSTSVATEQRLQASSGAAFDSSYARDMVQDHQQDVADFQKEAGSGQDPALKAFAQKYLPVLQHHLQMAQQISGGK
jgi:putative membrane protein